MVAGTSLGGDRPFGVALATGSVVSVAGRLVASAFGTERARLTVLAVAVALFAITIRAALAAVLTAVIGWSLYLAFLVERAGEPRWHGGVDAWRLAAGGWRLAAGGWRLGIVFMAATAGSATWPLRDRCVTGSTDADRSLLRQVTIARAGPGPFKETTVMADLALIVLTLAVFAMLGLVVKAVGRL